jgi:catechol 2,3-dioxygenase-like lactoylglutathione lyase family enzyme
MVRKDANRVDPCKNPQCWDNAVMKPTVAGIHHITAMAGAPQANLDFYARVLGLRFVKRTVNFDDPFTYHFYFGNETGQPGTILTFFPWGASSFKGRIGTGQVSVTAFSIPPGSIDHWVARLARHDVVFDGPEQRFDETFLSLRDPDGVALELVETGSDQRPAWSNGDIPEEHAIRGFHHAALSLEGFERSAELLTQTLGFSHEREKANRFRFRAGDGQPGTIIDLVAEPDRAHGNMGVGVVHHIAFRAASDEDQVALRDALAAAGADVTPVIDRQYFHSIYFLEPGGVLFEIATDAPGFLTDESSAELGTHLKLPAWLESQRARIDARVAPIKVPASNNRGTR